MESCMKKIAKETYDNWAKEFESSFWANTTGWGMAFCNQFNIEDDNLWAEDNRMIAEIKIFEQYVDASLAPEEEKDTEFDWTPYPTLSAEIKEDILNYINKGEEPDGFLVSVLCNDLVNAVGRSTDEEFAMLRDLINFIYKEMPYETWGNHRAVVAYQRRFMKLENENV